MDAPVALSTALAISSTPGPLAGVPRSRRWIDPASTSAVSIPVSTRNWSIGASCRIASPCRRARAAGPCAQYRPGMSVSIAVLSRIEADAAAEAGQVLVAGLGLKLRGGAAVGAQAPGPADPVSR